MPFTRAKSSRKRATRKRVSRPIGSTLRASQLAASTRRHSAKRVAPADEIMPPAEMMAIEDVAPPPEAYVPPNVQVSCILHGQEANPGDVIRIPSNMEVFLFSKTGRFLNTVTARNIKVWLIKEAASLKTESLQELHNKRISYRSRDPTLKHMSRRGILENLRLAPEVIPLGSLEESATKSTITIFRGDSECPNLTLNNNGFDSIDVMGITDIDKPDPHGKGSAFNRDFIGIFKPGLKFKLADLLRYIVSRVRSEGAIAGSPKIRLYLMCCRVQLMGIHLPVIQEEGASQETIGSINSQGQAHPRRRPVFQSRSQSRLVPR